MEEVIDIRTLQCYQKATEEQRKKCTSKLSFEIGKLPTLKLQEEWTFYIKHCGEVKSLSSVRQETVYFKRVCEFMNHLSVDSMKVQTKAVWGQQFESWVSAQGLKAYRESNKNKNWRERTPIVLYFLHMLDFIDSEMSGQRIFFNTNLAAAVACCAALIFTWIRYKKPDVSMTYNAALAGLVGITAGCDAVDAVGAAVIGVVCGILIVLAIEFFDKIAKIDDPVGAVSVHCVCGAAGTVLTGLFATGETTEAGLFYGGGAHFLGIQVLGVLAVAAYVAVVITIVFLAIKHTIGLRVKPEEELAGLDVSEHGLFTAYAGFSMLPDTIAEDVDTNTVFAMGDVPEAEAVPVKTVPAFEEGTPKFTKVEIVCKESKLEALKAAMMNLGITGMTVSHVLGCGVQKGKPEYYRGVQIEANLLPKIQVEIVVSKVPVRSVIETAKKVLYTGHIGDGKIFVYDVENVVKIRTGEEGFDALQDVE